MRNGTEVLPRASLLPAILALILAPLRRPALLIAGSSNSTRLPGVSLYVRHADDIILIVCVLRWALRSFT